MPDVGSSAARRTKVDRLRVATLNLQGRDGAWADRRSVLVDGLRELEADVVAFQDVIRTDDYDQAGSHWAAAGGQPANGLPCGAGQ